MDTDWSIVSQSWFWDEDAIFKKSCSGSEWSREEEKAFENALAIHHNDADKWEKIALAVPGKTVGDTKLHFEALRDDVAAIESGKVPLPRYPSKGRVRRSRKKTPVAGVRRGKPWTEDEHRQFLRGLEMFGKGDWKRISRYSVCSRSNSQVASHAQKYYKRLMANKGKRQSINDIRSVKPECLVALEKPTTSHTPKPTEEKPTDVKNHKPIPQNPKKASTYNENQVLPAYPVEVSTDTVNQLFDDYLSKTLINIRNQLFSPRLFSGMSVDPFSGHAIEYNMFTDPFASQPTQELHSMFTNPFAGQPTQELLSTFTDPFAGQPTQEFSKFIDPFSGQPTPELGMFMDPFSGKPTQELGMFTNPFCGQSTQELSMLIDPFAGQPTQELGCTVEMPAYYPPFAPIQDVGAPSVGWLDMPSASFSNILEPHDSVGAPSVGWLDLPSTSF